jgi:O-antigen/teichoic acid export membrane protein
MSEERTTIIGQRASLLPRPNAWVTVTPLPVARRGLVSTVGIAVQGLVRFCYSLLIGRTLPAGFLSATNSAISTAMLSTLLWPTSLASAAGKFLAREAGAPERNAALTHHLSRLCLISSVLLSVAAASVTGFWLVPGHPLTAVFVGLLTLGYSGYTFVRSAHYATNRVARATAWDVLSFLVSVLGLVLVLVFGMNDLLLLPITVGYLAYTALGWPRGSKGDIDDDLRHEVGRYVLWGVLGSLATSGFLQLTMVLAHQTGDTEGADAYAAALTLATPASMIGSVLSLLLLPSLSEAVGRGDLDSVRRQTDVASRGLVAVLGAVFGVLIVGSRIVVALIWPNLSGTVPILEMLLVATFLLTIATACNESINSMSRNGARTLSLIRAAGFAVGLGLAITLVSDMSVSAIAIGYLAGMLITGLIPIGVVWVRDRQRWTPTAFRVLAGVILAAGAVVLRNAWGPVGWHDLLLVVLFVTGWFALLSQDARALSRR